MSGMPGVYQLHAQDRAFMQGVMEGRAAKARNDRLTPYLRVGIDDYAKGYRSGFFARMDSATPDRVTDGGTRT